MNFVLKINCNIQNIALGEKLWSAFPESIFQGFDLWGPEPLGHLDLVSKVACTEKAGELTEKHNIWGDDVIDIGREEVKEPVSGWLHFDLSSFRWHFYIV